MTTTPNIPDTSNELLFNDVYNLWMHDLDNKSWDISSYYKICDISNIEKYWNIFNNMDKLEFKKNSIYITKNNILPVWEDKHNTNGMAYSFKISIDDSMELFQELCLRAIINQLPDINCVSFSPKPRCSIIKIWHNNNNIDITNNIIDALSNKYSDLHILKTNIVPQ